MNDLAGLASRAVEATLAAGAADAEAYASRGGGREVRVHGGEVESLTAATQRGIGVRAWIGRPGRLRIRHRPYPRAGSRRWPPAPPRRPRSPTRTSSPGPPPGERGPAPGRLSDPSIDEWQAGDAAELALSGRAHRPRADPRIAGVEQAVYADSAERVAIVSSTGIAGELRVLQLLRLSCRSWPRATGAGRPGSASVSPAAPPGSTRRRSAARGPSARRR